MVEVQFAVCHAKIDAFPNHTKQISSTVKPILTDQNKEDRLQFCLTKGKFHGYVEDLLYNYVHIDEKKRGYIMRTY